MLTQNNSLTNMVSRIISGVLKGNVATQLPSSNKTGAIDTGSGDAARFASSSSSMFAANSTPSTTNNKSLFKTLGSAVGGLIGGPVGELFKTIISSIPLFNNTQNQTQNITAADTIGNNALTRASDANNPFKGWTPQSITKKGIEDYVKDNPEEPDVEKLFKNAQVYSGTTDQADSTPAVKDWATPTITSDSIEKYVKNNPEVPDVEKLFKNAEVYNPTETQTQARNTYNGWSPTQTAAADAINSSIVATAPESEAAVNPKTGWERIDQATLDSIYGNSNQASLPEGAQPISYQPQEEIVSSSTFLDESNTFEAASSEFLDASSISMPEAISTPDWVSGGWDNADFSFVSSVKQLNNLADAMDSMSASNSADVSFAGTKNDRISDSGILAASA